MEVDLSLQTGSYLSTFKWWGWLGLLNPRGKRVEGVETAKESTDMRRPSIAHYGTEKGVV